MFDPKIFDCGPIIKKASSRDLQAEFIIGDPKWLDQGTTQEVLLTHTMTVHMV